MTIKVIREVATKLFLSADFSQTAFVDADRVSDSNDATWLDELLDEDAAVLGCVPNEFEIVSLSEIDSEIAPDA